jgi:hypothetical protein
LNGNERSYEKTPIFIKFQKKINKKKNCPILKKAVENSKKEKK